MTKVCVINGDITQFPVDVIVNAANPVLRGGGGVDGAIHRAAGPELARYMAENEPLGCHTGQACISPAFDLEQIGVRYIVHTVGPDCRLYTNTMLACQLLELCYENSILLAQSVGARTVAFPAISAGVYGMPINVCARIAVGIVYEYIQAGELDLAEVRFMTWGLEATQSFENAIREWDPLP